MNFERGPRAIAVTLALTGFVQCSSSGAPSDPRDDDGGSYGGDASSPDGVDASSDRDASSGGPERCSSADVEAFATCIDGDSPAACVAQIRKSEPLCDVDGDGLDDALEDAMMRAYAPVFAFNKGDGGHTAGDSESSWPVSAAHYVSHSRLVWRIDNDGSTLREVDAAPTLATLPGASFDDGGKKHLANSPLLGEGPNFWLCMKKSGDDYVPGALVTSLDASRALDGGIDVFTVVHPTVAGKPDGYVVLSYMLYYAYNPFTLDNHEGDWEGGAVFVDMKTGKVTAFYTDRHATADDAKLLHLEGDGAVPAKDPKLDSPTYNVCSSSWDGDASGVRFWDYDGERRHPVLYVAGGSHASYAYPGGTKITGAGCVEKTIVRDVHNGKGPRFVPSEGGYAIDWNEGQPLLPVEHGVSFKNLGEPGHLREAWSAFAGQWGCTYESIPKSYPGPWDNQRLCRKWLTASWGAAPPFILPAKTACTDSP